MCRCSGSSNVSPVAVVAESIFGLDDCQDSYLPNLCVIVIGKLADRLTAGCKTKAVFLSGNGETNDCIDKTLQSRMKRADDDR